MIKSFKFFKKKDLAATTIIALTFLMGNIIAVATPSQAWASEAIDHTGHGSTIDVSQTSSVLDTEPSGSITGGGVIAPVEPPTNDTATATATEQNQTTTAVPYFMVDTDMGREVIYFISPDDRLATVDLSADPNYPGGMPLHTLILPDGKKAYLTTMSSNESAATIIALRINDIDWNAGTADVDITNVMEIAGINAQPFIAIPNQTSASQPITALWIPNNQQIHGPTLHPSGTYAYFTQWTDDKIRVVDTTTDQLAESDPIQNGILSRQLHGIFFNPSGTKALATGYFFDLNHVISYDVTSGGGNLELSDVITLEGTSTNNSTNDNNNNTTRSYAAFPHFVRWLDDRYAITSTQQLGPTSATPLSTQVIGPSVWLIDTDNQTANMIIGPTDSVNGSGIYKPASDIAIIGNKLYVAEEDSMDEEINNDGYVSVWDISNISTPTLINRLGPGNGLPEDFQLGHALYPTPDERYVYVQSWNSGHLVKIDTSTDAVVHVFDKDDGFVLPHGGFVTGTTR